MAQINKSSDYFNTKLYTGTGSSQAVTGVGFQPDWLWIKNRGTADENIVFDSVRGVDKRLLTDGTQSELTTTNHLSSFDSDGFTVPGLSANTGASSNNYVAWNWLASNTTASNTDGSITSTVSANTTSGFSIVSWTGSGANATIGHSLGAVPKMIIIRRRTGSTTNWIVYHESIGNNNELFLNLTNASTSSTRFQSTSPTSSVFSVSSNSAVNESSQSHIAYCFSEKKGFSKAFSYTGNGSTDGSFCYLGMKPSFVLLKETGNANNWMIFDNKRSPFNLMDDFISPDISDAETTGNANNRMDMLSNGFKTRGTGSATNRSGGTYIGIAFAENPIVGSNGVPSCAR